MDPNLLKHIEYFLEPNSQVRSPSRRPGADPPAALEEDMSGARGASGANASQTDGDLSGQQQRRFDPAGAAASSSSQSFWDIAGLNVDSAMGSPSTAPTSLSFESFAQTAPAAAKPQQSRPQQMFGQGSRVILPPRPPKSKTGHERKRTKLSTESTPFDNVDYWLQFDNEEGATGEASSAELSHQKGKEMQQSPQQSQQQHQSQRRQQPQQQQPEQQQIQR